MFSPNISKTDNEHMYPEHSGTFVEQKHFRKRFCSKHIPTKCSGYVCSLSVLEMFGENGQVNSLHVCLHEECGTVQVSLVVSVETTSLEGPGIFSHISPQFWNKKITRLLVIRPNSVEVVFWLPVSWGPT